MSLCATDAVDRWLQRVMEEEAHARVKVFEPCIVDDTARAVRFIVLTGDAILATVRCACFASLMRMHKRASCSFISEEKGAYACTHCLWNIRGEKFNLMIFAII